MWRNKFFSLINIFGLSVGIACCMLIFLYASDEITYDRFHEKANRIYRITLEIQNSKGELNKSPNTGTMQGPRFASGIPEIEEFVRVQDYGCTAKIGTEVVREDALCVDESFFSVFSFSLIEGDPKTALKDPFSIVISEELAKKYFGKETAIGKTIELNTRREFRPFVVSGILKKMPQNSSIQTDLLFSTKLEELDNPNETHWMNYFLNTFVVLKEGADVSAIEKRCDAIFDREAASQLAQMRKEFGFDDKTTYHLQPLAQMHLSTDYPAQNGLSNASNPMYSYILTGIAAFILLIACINFVNLSVARLLKRAKEIGVRKVIGGKRRQLIMQFMGESTVLAAISFALAILLVVIVLPFFNEVAEKQLSFFYLLDVRLASAYIGLFLLTSFLSGFYPSIVLSRFKPVDTLYGKLRFSAKNYLSQGLVVVQFALATILIISTITIYRQFSFLTNYSLGYDKSNVLRVVGGRMDALKLENLKAELKREPGIQHVSAQQGGDFFTMAHINGEQTQEFGYMRIDNDYFPMYKIPIVQGRNFSTDHSSDSSESLMVNEAFVRAAGWKQPIGETIDFYYRQKKYKVVGVVRDFHTAPLTEKIQPYVFSQNPELSYQAVFMKIEPKRQAEVLRHTEKTFRSFFPMRPYQFSFIEDDVKDSYRSEAKWKQIISFGAILTIFISCIGLFGLAALSAERRAKEISIRKVLGASVSLIVQKLSGDFAKLVILSAVIALPVSWWASNKWLENYPYRIELKATMFLFAVVIVFFIALVTIVFQSVKAAMANPVKILRTE